MTAETPAQTRLLAGFVALGGFALLQPLLDVLARYPEFLAVHAARSGDLAVLVAAAALAVPAACWLATAAAFRAHPALGAAAQALLLGALAATAALPAAGRLPLPGPAWTLAAALAAGAAFALLHRRSVLVRRVLPAFALAVPAFVAVFLADPGVRAVLRPAPAAAVSGDRGADVPVIVVVFDELPVTSLQDADGGVDADLFPAFAALAADAVWYREATTVSSATLRAVPAILAGVTPGWDTEPTAAAYPRSLFTLLAGSHRLVVDEAQTNLCPPALARGLDTATRLERLLRDSAIVWLHTVVPAGWRDGLPPIGTRWSDFGEDPDRLDRAARFRAWVARLEAGDRPLLGFVHTLLPHNPYRRTPRGRIYHWRERELLTEDGRWGPDPVVVRDAWRAHLLQLAFTDRLLGELLQRLRALGVYDEALIVVTADHGCAFRPGASHRRLEPATLPDIVSVPLFVKYPRGEPRGEDRRRARTTDILPTVLDVLGLDAGAAPGGRSLRAPAPPAPAHLAFLDQDRREVVTVPADSLAARRRTRAAKLAVFGDPDSPWDLVRRGPHGDLVGTPLADLDVAVGPARATLRRPRALAEVDTSGLFIPAELTGTVRLDGADGDAWLAVAANGVVAGVGRPRRPDPGRPDREWSIVIEPWRLRPGANDVSLLRVVDTPGGPRRLVELNRWFHSVRGEALGGRPRAGVAESGFHKNEAWDGTPFRWTDGRARLRVPLARGDRPDTLRCRLVATGPQGTRLTIRVDGTTILEETLPAGPWAGAAPLPPGGDERRALDVEIASDIFVPGGQDDRTLGVGVESIVLE